MSKIKVSELAKELDKSSRDIIVALKRCCRVFVEGHNSVITEDQAQKVRDFLIKQDAEKTGGAAGQISAVPPVIEKKPAPAAQTKYQIANIIMIPIRAGINLFVFFID